MDQKTSTHSYVWKDGTDSACLEVFNSKWTGLMPLMGSPNRHACKRPTITRPPAARLCQNPATTSVWQVSCVLNPGCSYYYQPRRVDEAPLAFRLMAAWESIPCHCRVSNVRPVRFLTPRSRRRPEYPGTGSQHMMPAACVATQPHWPRRASHRSDRHASLQASWIAISTIPAPTSPHKQLCQARCDGLQHLSSASILGC